MMQDWKRYKNKTKQIINLNQGKNCYYRQNTYWYFIDYTDNPPTQWSRKD